MLPLAFYGILMSRPDSRARRLFSDLGEYGEDCVIPGVLYSAEAFPALVPGDGAVEGQLWYPFPGCEDLALATFDRVESYHEDEPEASMYLRRPVRLIKPEIIAQTYWWNFSTRGLDRIENGSWRKWVAAQNAASERR